MSGRVAFVCAMPMEMAPLRRPLQLRTTDAGPPRLFEGVLDGRPVAAVTTGMGPDLARLGMGRLLASVDVERVVVVGITGAVDNDTPIGTLIQPETVVDGATGVAYRPHPLGQGQHAGTMWTTAELITDLDRVAALRGQGVVALDMETSAIGAACDARGIPWSVVRVISDRASDGSIDEEMFAISNQDGTLKPKAALAYMARHPRRLPELARMGRQAKGATKRAAALAVDAVREHWRSGGP
jgi:adenosylhomocysteine nucleosidase